jgi:hypothetical protein
LLAVHLLALAGLFFTALPYWLSGLLAAMVVASLAASYRRNGGGGGFVRELVWLNPTEWRLRTADGNERPGRLLGYHVHPRVIVLNFSLSRFKRRSVVLLWDACHPEPMRQLRSRLRRLEPSAD